MYKTRRYSLLMKAISLLLLLISLSITGCRSFHNREEYAKSVTKRPINVKPYILKFQTGDAELLYYGSFHTVNPANLQFKDIEKKWKSFNPTIALCEGNIWPRTSSRSEAIRQYGEQGLLRFLADRDGVRIICLEPPRTMELRYLLKKFSVEQIKIYYILRQAVVQRILRKNIQNTDYVVRALRNLARHNLFKTIIPTQQDFHIRVRQMFPNLTDWRLIPLCYFDITKKNTWLSQIHKQVNKYRDHHMVQKISKALKRGARVFALVGKNHVINQAPALSKLIRPTQVNLMVTSR